MSRSPERVSILYTGATGYIGGSVLQRILAHPKASTFDITALVRNTEKARLLESNYRVKVSVGSLQDLDKLAELAENSHIVVHTANADHEPAIKAILAGLKKRHEKLGDIPILIHTSGAASLIDDARGEFASSTITSDLDIATLEALPSYVPHRNTDLLVTSADTDGYARTYIVSPSGIYGIAHGPLFDTGIAHKHSISIPWLTNVFSARGRGGIVGKGANVTSNVHIDDTAELYYLLFDKILSTPAEIGHGREGYYFVEADENTMYDVVKAIGEALVTIGRVDEAEPTVLTPEERVQYFGNEQIAFMLFANVRCRADRARRDLGWKPQYTTKDFISGVHAEVKAILNA